MTQVSHCMTKKYIFEISVLRFFSEKTISWIYKIVEKYLIGFLKSKVFFVKGKIGDDWEGDCDVVEITQKDFTPTWGGFVFGVFQL